MHLGCLHVFLFFFSWLLDHIIYLKLRREKLLCTGLSFSEARNNRRTCCVQRLFWRSKQKKKQFMYKSCSPDVLSLQFSIFMKMFCQSFWHRFICKADQIHKMTTISIKMTPLFILRSYNYYRALVHPAQFWLSFLWFAQLYITDPVTSFLARDKSHDSTANS